jgi:hypothetical protein
MRMFGGNVAVLDRGWVETRGRIVGAFDHGTVARSMMRDAPAEGRDIATRGSALEMF